MLRLVPECAVIPRIQVSRGRAMVEDERGRLVAGGPAREVVRAALDARERAVIADLIGIRRNRPDLDLLKAFEGEAVWSEAGARNAEGVIDLLVAGAEAVVLSTATLASVEEMHRAHEMTENLLLQLEFDGEFLAPPRKRRPPDPGSLRDEAAGLGLAGIIVMDFEGWRPHRDLLRARGVPLYAGLGEERDAFDLAALDVAGVIIPPEGV